MNPKVDVIIPSYNGLPWLKETVDSVLKQTYKNLKLYIIDDGSTDKTSEYVRSLKDDRIVYKKKKNGGQSTARNMGIELSDSPFVAFLDSDDIWYPQKLEKQMEIMLAKPEVGLVYGHHYVIDENSIIHTSNKAFLRGAVFDELCKGNAITGSASMVLLRRAVLEKIGLFRTDLVNGEDWEMWLRISKSYEIDFVPDIIAEIRNREDSEQKNIIKMADGLVDTYRAIVSGLGLSREQRIYVSSYCLFNAANMYYSKGKRKQARHHILLLLKENPRALIEFDNWRFRFRVGIYYRVLLSNSVTRFIKSLFADIWKLVGVVMQRLRRLLKLIFIG